jgi:hypothetical protein
MIREIMNISKNIGTWLTSFVVPEQINEHRKKKLWGHMLRTLDITLHIAIRNPAFIFCFVGVMILAGSIGVWLPYVFCKSNELLRPEALLTYGLSILASILAETLLSQKSRNLGVVMLGYLLGLAAVCFLLIGYFETFDVGNKSFSLIGLFFILLIWFFSKGTDEIYNSTNNDAPIGGEIDESASDGLQGNGLDNIQEDAQSESESLQGRGL